jgi:hypothetical protein
MPVPEARSESPGASLWRRPSAWLALALGVAVRVVALTDKPFWRDEAWVAVLAQEPVEQALTGPRRAAPVGFLLAVRASSAWPLPPELSLRLLPLVAGLATVVALPALARRLGAISTVERAVLWLAAGTPALVYYSRELKPYSLDVLVATLAAIHVLDRSGAPDRGSRWTGWAALAVLAIAPWMTFGSVFGVVAALATGLILARRQERPAARRLAWALAVYGVSLAAAWTSVIARQAASPRIAETWAPDLAAYRPTTPAAVARAVADYAAHSVGHLYPVATLLAAALAVLGAATWRRPGRDRVLTLCALTAAGTVAAALAGWYPLAHGRLLLFAAPGLMLLVASGLGVTSRWLGRFWPPGRHLAVGVAAISSMAWSADMIRHRYRADVGDAPPRFLYDVIHEVEPMITSAEALRAPGDQVMVSKYAGEPFRYYARGRLADALVCTRVECRTEGPVLRRWLESVGDGRGWLILLAEDDEPARRRVLSEAGYTWREAARSRGARLWQVRRAPR